MCKIKGTQDDSCDMRREKQEKKKEKKRRYSFVTHNESMLYEVCHLYEY